MSLATSDSSTGENFSFKERSKRPVKKYIQRHLIKLLVVHGEPETRRLGAGPWRAPLVHRER